MSVKDKQINIWLRFAQDDLKAAEISLDGRLPSIVCFHSQQAVEKCLKALYLRFFATVPKTHNLEVIFTRLKKILPEISKFEEKIRYLNKFYVPTRYPDALPGSMPEGLPDPDEAKRATKFAKEILLFILKLLQTSSTS